MRQTIEKMTVEIEDGGTVEPIAICGMGRLSPDELLYGSHVNKL